MLLLNFRRRIYIQWQEYMEIKNKWQERENKIKSRSRNLYIMLEGCTKQYSWFNHNKYFIKCYFIVARIFNMRFILLTKILRVQYSIIECRCNVVKQVSRTFPTLFEPFLKYLGYFKTFGLLSLYILLLQGSLFLWVSINCYSHQSVYRIAL